MEILYSVLMSGVILAILASLVEAVRAVSRKPSWETVIAPKAQAGSPPEPVQVELKLVVTEDRRKHNLPFVGEDRRKPGSQPEKESAVQAS